MTLGPRLVALAGLLLMTACADDTPATVHLDVTVQDWTGWSEEQPEPVELEHDVVEGESFDVDVLGGELTVTVTEVTDDEITLETSDAMAPRSGDGGADLNDTTDTFTLERGGEVVFGTPTMDAGTTVTIAE